MSPHNAHHEHIVKIKRVYDPPEEADGIRILVDRLWPRGLKEEEARIDLWLKEAAPSGELREWFGHSLARWEEFRQRYRDELSRETGALHPIRERAKHKNVTLLYGARDRDHNNAVVLKEYLDEIESREHRKAA